MLFLFSVQKDSNVGVGDNVATVSCHHENALVYEYTSLNALFSS